MNAVRTGSATSVLMMLRHMLNSCIYSQFVPLNGAKDYGKNDIISAKTHGTPFQGTTARFDSAHGVNSHGAYIGTTQTRWRRP